MAREGTPLIGQGLRVTKHDPLLAKGSSRVAAAMLRGMEDEGGKHHVALRTMVLTAGSCTVFASMLFTVSRFYHRAPLSTLFIAVQLILAGTVLSLIWRRERWHRWLGRFLAFAALAGTAVGLYVYYRYLVYFYHYREAKVYLDVAASEPAALYADAGIVTFKADTRLDISQSVGYRSAELGATLCVAPILDGHMSAKDAISFFAAGVDCCAWRSRFQCGDAADPDASSGLLHLQPAQLVTPPMEWAVEDHLLMEGFKRAVKLQTAVFGTVASETPRFLRWARDPQALQTGYLHQAMAASATACTAFFGASLAAAFLAAVGWRRLSAALGDAAAAAAGGAGAVGAMPGASRAQGRSPVDAFGGGS